VAEITQSELKLATGRRSAEDAARILDALQIDGSIEVVDDPEPEVDEDGIPVTVVQATSVQIKTDEGFVPVGDHLKQEAMIRAGGAAGEEAQQRRDALLQGYAYGPQSEIEEAKRRLDSASEESEEWIQATSKSATQQVMDEHEAAKDEAASTEAGAESLPRTHAELDALAKKQGVDLSDATTVAEKQDAILAAQK
jgi:hypothetical protein